ncbi:MAG: HesA/MoeB/ThiF family protein, partial [Thermoguttaceae bacterium]
METTYSSSQNSYLLSRYSRQIPIIGIEGQKQLSQSRVLIVGCGALGGMVAQILVRAGVGDSAIFDAQSFFETNNKCKTKNAQETDAANQKDETMFNHRGVVALIDSDVVQFTNLHRQIIFNEDDAKSGRLKVEAALKVLKEACATTSIEIFPTRLDDTNLSLFKKYDIIIDATDNF